MKANNKLNFYQTLKMILHGLFKRSAGSWGSVGVDSKDKLRGF